MVTANYSPHPVRRPRAGAGVNLPRKSVTDSFEIIKALLARSPEPTHLETLEIFDALHDVYWRIKRVRQIAPTVDYSEKIWRLIGMVGMKPEPLVKSER